MKFLSKKERERLKNEREELEKAKLEDQLSSATKEKVQTSSAPTTSAIAMHCHMTLMF